MTLEVLLASKLHRIILAESRSFPSDDGEPTRRAHRWTQRPVRQGCGAFAHGVAAVFDCGGHADCLQQSVEISGYGARIIVLGIAASPSAVEMLTVALKELSIIGSTAYNGRDFVDALQLLASGTVDATSLIKFLVRTPAVPISAVRLGDKACGGQPEPR